MPADATNGQRSTRLRSDWLLLVEGRDEVNLFDALMDHSIGVFIVPDGNEPGAIETLCRRSKEGDEVAICVEEYLSCLDEHEAMKSTNVDKSFAHAYLAAMEDPVVRVGEGAKQGAWNFGSPAFAELSEFLRELASRGR